LFRVLDLVIEKKRNRNRKRKMFGGLSLSLVGDFRPVQKSQVSHGNPQSASRKRFTRGWMAIQVAKQLTGDKRDSLP
jgi:hypothetical protein